MRLWSQSFRNFSKRSHAFLPPRRTMATVNDLSEHLKTLGLQTSPPQSITSFPDLNPVDVWRIGISKELSKVAGVDEALIYPALQWSQTLEKGDLNIAVPRLRVKGMKPDEQAKKWAEEFPQDKLLKQPTTAGINIVFWFSPTILPKLVLPYIFKLGRKYGFNPAVGYKKVGDPASGRKKVIVEFSSPNIAKEFHAGHLRSTIIGGFLARLYEENGYEVVKMNYLGDWGRQYGLLAIGWQLYGSEELLRQNATAHLFDVYVKIAAQFKPEEAAYKEAKALGKDTQEIENSGLYGQAKNYFKRMEARDEEALQVWSRFRNMSIEKYKKSYSRLNIEFDEYNGESQVLQSTMNKAEQILKEKGITEFNEGAWIIDFKKHGAPKLDVAIVRNRNNTTTYLLRDIGSAIQRYEQHGFDNMIYVIMFEQGVHVQRLFKALELMGGEYASIGKSCQLVDFGKVLGMSTRRGTAKFLDDILNECATSMHDVMKKNEAKYEQVEDPDKTADTLGISAVMVQDMKGKRINNYPFDIERMTSFEGDTGPYLQYAHARMCSVARKAGYTADDLAKADFSLLTEPHAIDLVRLVAQFPDQVTQTLKTLEPTTILTYLFKLTHGVSSSYDHLRVFGAVEGPEVSLARAALYEATRQVLSNGMELLGLSPVDRM